MKDNIFKVLVLFIAFIVIALLWFRIGYKRGISSVKCPKYVFNLCKVIPDTENEKLVSMLINEKTLSIFNEFSYIFKAGFEYKFKFELYKEDTEITNEK